MYIFNFSVFSTSEMSIFKRVRWQSCFVKVISTFEMSIFKRVRWQSCFKVILVSEWNTLFVSWLYWMLIFHRKSCKCFGWYMKSRVISSFSLLMLSVFVWLFVWRFVEGFWSYCSAKIGVIEASNFCIRNI